MAGRTRLAVFAFAAALACVTGCKKDPETVVDEAMKVGRDAKSFPAADEDYFHDMDKGVKLSADAVKGRNNWNVWTGGNDRFWDHLANNSFGALDLLKTVSSHPKLAYNRNNRWFAQGLVNEPCFEKATGPDPERFGLWLDKRKADCGPDPFENESKYPGVKIGARGSTVPVGSFYGTASGIMGLRLFPNPDFNEEAKKKWDAKRYYEDAAYYEDKNLVRPYRVGMSCGFCHIGPSPVRPPADPNNPKFENLASNPGAQYFWVDRVLFWNPDETSFVYQLFHTSLPGTLDTSFVSTDSINNPRTMNAVYNVMPRLNAAKIGGREKLAGGGLGNKQFNDYPRTQSLSDWFSKPDTVLTPRVLKDGSDSVGVLGALNRVYINIGLFSEEWLRHFNPLIGGKEISPIRIEDLNKNSSYWNATQEQTPDVALFFLASATPDYLKDAPGGNGFSGDAAKMARGKIVFAENCARCHSSKQPAICEGSNCKPGEVVQDSEQYLQWMRAEVQKPDFLDGNYLSTERRIPVSELQTNACSPLATNAIGGNIWDNFSSQTYKELPAVGTITIYNPVDGTPMQYNMPGGGRGYTRPASLVSLWSSAPYLLNNSVGEFEESPSVNSRMRAFQTGIEQMLWPEKRRKDPKLGDNVPGPGARIPGPSYIQRTTTASYVKVATGYMPDSLQKLFSLFNNSTVVIGPIPSGTPVGLLSNLDVTPTPGDPAARIAHDKKLLDLLTRMVSDLKKAKGKSEDEAREIFRPLVPDLLALSKCPDLVINKGHYFGTKLSDNDKRSLIAFLKTF